jgi:hypothetical protein
MAADASEDFILYYIDDARLLELEIPSSSWLLRAAINFSIAATSAG